MKVFPCVAIVGPRQCGKTTLLQSLPQQWKRFDMEKQSDCQIVSRDPDLFFELNPRHVAIDEAQILPSLFPALRVAIDRHRQERGRFVITGSSSPQLLKEVSESLAGRMGIIELSPFSWEEVRPPAMDQGVLDRFLKGARNPDDLVTDVKATGTLQKVHEYWFRGGYPEPWIEGAKFQDHWMEQYVQTYLYRDVMRLFPGLNQERFRMFIQMLSGFSGTILNYADAARVLSVSQPTARDYFSIAHGTFLWRLIRPFDHRTGKRLIRHPKGYLRDSGMLHHLLRLPDMRALLGHPKVGVSWEGMVIEEILRRLAWRGEPAEASYYRTSAGAEIDLVVEGKFGLLPVEVKYTQRVDLRDMRAIRDFMTEHECKLGLVINNDDAPRHYGHGVVGVPFLCL